MTYNLANPLDVENARIRLEGLIRRGCFAELTEKKPKRTLSQNSYLHVVLAYLAVQTGNTLDWVKREYYKKTCNPDLFVRERQDKFLGSVKYLRSSAELDTREMTLSIQRLRNWASSEAEVYIPEPHEQEKIALMQMEVERNKEWIY